MKIKWVVFVLTATMATTYLMFGEILMAVIFLLAFGPICEKIRTNEGRGYACMKDWLKANPHVGILVLIYLSFLIKLYIEK